MRQVYAFKCLSGIATIEADPDFQKGFPTFLAEFTGSAEYASESGKATLPMRCIDVASMLAAAVVMPGEVRPQPDSPDDERVLQVQPPEMEAAIPAGKKRTVIQGLLGGESMYAWGMSPNKCHVGLDMLGLGTARVQPNGFRQVVIMNMAAVRTARRLFN